MFAHVLAEGVLVVGQKVALAADALVVNFVDVSGQSFGTGRFVVAQDAEVGFDVGVEMPFQTPVVHSSPGAVSAGVQLFLLLLLTTSATTGRC